MERFGFLQLKIIIVSAGNMQEARKRASKRGKKGSSRAGKLSGNTTRGVQRRGQRSAPRQLQVIHLWRVFSISYQEITLGPDLVILLVLGTDTGLHTGGI